MIGDLERYFSTELPNPRPGRPALRPVQRAGFGRYGPPLIVGGTGDSVLRIAARHAQVISVPGTYQVKGQPPGTFRLASATDIDERVAFAAACAGKRSGEIEWHLLVQAVVITDDRSAAAEELVAQHRREFEKMGVTDQAATLTVAETLESPFLLLGTADEIAAQLRRSRERWGYSYITVHEPYMRAFAPVIERLRSAG